MPEKEFVKAKPLYPPRDKGGGQKDYQPKEHPKKSKKYEEKQRVQQTGSRDGIKLMLAVHQRVKKTKLTTDLCRKYPKLFNQEELKPEKDGDFNFNDYLRLGPKKDNYTKQTKALSSDSSEPDWDSDCEKQVKLESKKIDEEVIKKVSEQIKKQPARKVDELQRHEKEFLQQYYHQKKNQLAQKELQIKQSQIKNKAISINEDESKKAQKAPSNEWDEYAPQVNNLIFQGFLQKIQNDQNGQDFQEDDFDWDEADNIEVEKKSEKEQSSQESDDGDDIFQDDHPRTITEKKDESQKLADAKKGMVFINDHLFTSIAEKIGIHPQACIWVISNKTDRFKVSTQYMDAFYRQKQLFKTFPYVSLNHSEFVKSEDIGTEKGYEKFKRFNERKKYQRSMNSKNYQNNRGKKQQHLYKPKK